jgi:hypothetical protein
MVYRRVLPALLALPQPPALTIEEQAARVGLGKETLSEARNSKSQLHDLIKMGASLVSKK